MKSSSPALRLLGAVVALLLLTLAPRALAAPSGLRPRPVADKQAQRPLPPDALVERLVVKFHEGSRVRLRDGALVPLASERSGAERALLKARGLAEDRLARDARAAQAVLEATPRLGAPRRLFLQEEAELEARQSSGEAREGQQLADLNLYYEVPLLPGTTAGHVAGQVAALLSLEGVEVAYAEPPAEPAEVGFGLGAAVRAVLATAGRGTYTPLYESQQGYLDAAPVGVDARYAWRVPGGDGAGVRFVDIEGGWRTTHEDMPGFFTEIGSQYNDLGWRNHGTAVVGVVSGAVNAHGVRGIAHAAAAGVSSIGSQSSASAISSAAAAVREGGVILIELHAGGPSDGTPCTCNQAQCNYIAMEYWQANYDAIATATANGVVVVEAAGNGSANLDAAAYGNAFNRDTRDSGAILVGASTSRTRVPMCWTNFGSRVDVHGWGENVASLGYGNLFSGASGEDQYYTGTFSGTSSASPIVTGSAVVLQGVRNALQQPALSSREVRALLTATGTPQASDARHIGPLPDLRTALWHLLGFARPTPGPIAGPGGGLAGPTP